ncbi:MAG TPA: type IVB secretion system protein DotA [Gammaproteobacteria bacterium]|nr:type IVB secretion system protein DotA [Gammaproteobacteria bacterium]
MKRWAFLGFLLLWPTLLFAQGNLSLPFSSSFGLTFTPAINDLSVIYLSNMFGQVDGVLFGTGSQLAGALFGVYNGAILVLGGIVVMYTFLMGTIKTAHEGEMLGQSKEWSSIWTPLRTVAGIALLIPKASGYSFIQIFIMWAIVQGIGVADSMWNVALDYLLKGGIVISQNYAGSNKTVGYSAQQEAWGAQNGLSPAAMAMFFGPPKTTYGSTTINTTPMIHGSAQLLSSLTCVEMLQQQLTNYQAAQKQTGTIPNFYTDIINAISASSPDSTTTTIPFPDSHYNGTDGACGSVTWGSIASSFAASGVSVPLSNTPLGAALQGNNDRATAVAATVSSLDSYARLIAQNYLSTPPSALGQLTAPGVWAGPNNSPFIINGSLLGDAAAAYYGTMSSTVRLIAQLAKDPTTVAAWTQGAKVQGWAMAGAFYFNIVTANNQILNVVDKNVPTYATPATNLSTDTRITNALGGPNSSYVQQLQSLINGQAGQNGSNDTIVASDGPFMLGAMAFGDQLSFGSTNIAPQTAQGSSTSGQVGQFLGPVNYVSSIAANWLTTLANSQQSNENPVVSIAGFGGSLANASYNALINMAVIGFVITFLLGLMPFDSLGAAGVSITTSVMGFFTPIFVSLLVAGLTMAFYIPMIPFIIFSFGVIGWFISVVEAMLAAPMVALGIAHPEGSHTILGKAEPAVGLLVNVFLRPTFMLFGLLFGMMISYIGIWLLNQGFGIAFSGATQGITTNGIFEPIACVIIYVLIAMQIVQKSFTLIYTIPDHVLRWIGISATQSFGGEGQAEQAIAQGAHGAFEKMGQHSGQVVETALKVGEESGKMVKEIVKAIVTRGKGGGAAKGAKGGGGGKGKGAAASGKAGKQANHSSVQAQGTRNGGGGGSTHPQQNAQHHHHHGGGKGGMGQQLTQIIQTIINNT